MHYVSSKAHEGRKKRGKKRNEKNGMKSNRAESVFISAAQKRGTSEATAVTPKIFFVGKHASCIIVCRPIS